MSVLEQITETDVMVREINQQLMVMWINADLRTRAHHDVRSSVVLYDAERCFVAALPAVSDEQVGRVADVLVEIGVRFWSRGIV